MEVLAARAARGAAAAGPGGAGLGNPEMFEHQIDLPYLQGEHNTPETVLSSPLLLAPAR